MDVMKYQQIIFLLITETTYFTLPLECEVSSYDIFIGVALDENMYSVDSA